MAISVLLSNVYVRIRGFSNRYAMQPENCIRGNEGTYEPHHSWGSLTTQSQGFHKLLASLLPPSL